MIPVLDLESGSERGRSKDLVEYLGTTGFVYLKNHGIPDSMIDSCRNAAKGFFAQNLDFKESFCIHDDYKYIGYKGFEKERLNPKQKEFDMREAVNYDAHDFPSNIWPDKPSEASTVPLMGELGALAGRILKMIGAGLNLNNPDLFYETHDFFKVNKPPSSKSMTVFRINHYPKLNANQLKEDQVLCGEHADFGTITLLIQDHVPGLEVQMTDGTFVEAKPMEGTILLNIGLLLENWTNGRLRATRHRVVKPTVEERMTLVLFVMPEEHVKVQPIQELNDSDAPIQYNSYHPAEFCHMMLAGII